ncbi:hypothetical protein RRG08_051982 [Elysia crispata]|uniref:Uncharacterized protein n=1 Tax=Elysia crispata TaxID=231223 RepID=A0AAE0ZCC7_9GAST|nr:hypothetical protein RRG08_051982 [Elysia crispata]
MLVLVKSVPYTGTFDIRTYLTITYRERIVLEGQWLLKSRDKSLHLSQPGSAQRFQVDVEAYICSFQYLRLLK